MVCSWDFIIIAMETVLVIIKTMILKKCQENHLVICVGCKVCLVKLSSITISCFCGYYDHQKCLNAFCPLGYLNLKLCMPNMLSAYNIKCQILHCLCAMIYCYLHFSACDMSLSVTTFCDLTKILYFVICVSSFVFTPFLCVCFKLSYLVLDVPFQFHLCISL